MYFTSYNTKKKKKLKKKKKVVHSSTAQQVLLFSHLRVGKIMQVHLTFPTA